MTTTITTTTIDTTTSSSMGAEVGLDSVAMADGDSTTTPTAFRLGGIGVGVARSAHLTSTQDGAGSAIRIIGPMRSTPATELTPSILIIVSPT